VRGSRQEKILPAQKRFPTFLTLAALQAQKLALRAQTVCAAGVPLREETFTKRRFDFALQNLFPSLPDGLMTGFALLNRS
jgi:hypothetical protein